MRVYDTNTQRMMVHYEEQLHKLGYYDTENKTYGELKHRLALERMKHIDYSKGYEVQSHVSKVDG